MTVENISWSISTKVWDQAGIELTTPGSAVRFASVARHVTDCATRPGRWQNMKNFPAWSVCWTWEWGLRGWFEPHRISAVFLMYPWARYFIVCLYLTCIYFFNPRNIMTWLKNCWLGQNTSNKFLFLACIHLGMYHKELKLVMIISRKIVKESTNEPQHEIFNNVVCATSKASDQPAHTRSLIRAFASLLNILWLLSYWLNIIWIF